MVRKLVDLIKHLKRRAGSLPPYLFSRNGHDTLRLLVANKLVNPVVRRFGFVVIADHWLSPFVRRSEVARRNEKQRALASIIDWQDQVEFTNNLLTKYRDEYNSGALYTCGYSEQMSGLIAGDAELLYAMVRDRKPSRVIEIGSGGSTLITLAALVKNVKEGAPTPSLISIDSYTQNWLKGQIEKVQSVNVMLVQKPAESVDRELFKTLSPNDILFVDSSHIFKPGSDVEFQVLELYPSLPKGVTIHIHDIYWPYGYPNHYAKRNYWFWNEQYFVEMMLKGTDYRMLTCASMVRFHKREVFATEVPSYHESSLWLIKQ